MAIAVSDIEGLHAYDEERHDAKPAEVVQNPMNPRRDVGDVSTLAESMASGQLQPITVVTRDRWLAVCPEHEQHVGEAAYIAVTGSRRLAAAQQKKLRCIDIVVKNELAKSRESLLHAALTENFERVDLATSEIAAVVAELYAVRKNQKLVATDVQRSQNWVSQMLAVSRLAPDMQARVDAGEVTLKQAAELVKHEPQEQEAAWQQLSTPPKPEPYSSAIQQEPAEDVANRSDDENGSRIAQLYDSSEPDPATTVEMTPATVVEPVTEQAVYSSAIQNDPEPSGPGRPQPYRPKKPTGTEAQDAESSAVEELATVLRALPAGQGTAEVVASAVRRGLAQEDVIAVAKHLQDG